ncbi:MAG: InlB B-repeat-containing protein, partial [Clostridia bacterium]|nr:InlB B-repeat-containing protein [Clostridia bacterium]
LFHWLRLYGIETNDFKDAMNATYRLEKVYKDSDVKGPVTQIANTCFMYNYCDAPNDGYFFINDFERGGLIENTPYEPTREGYVFAGWYKEPECINPWNFETDTLPEAEYDENGELVFVETILYAGWNKI